MQQNGEPSVEEILESIKKVIARDNKDSASAERHRRETEGVVLRGPGATFGLTPLAGTGNDDDFDDEDDGSEVLELGDAATEMLDDSQDDGAEDDAPVEAWSFADEVSENELIAPPAATEPAEAALENSPAEPAPLELQVAQSVRPPLEMISAMPEVPADQPEPAAAETGPPETETPLERMVRESLRPMLREWLDANLPPIVERMVKTELERIMGKLS